MFVVFSFCFLTLISVSSGAGCRSTNPNYGPQNNLPVLVHPKPTLVASNTYGKHYNVTVPNWGGNTTTAFHLVHLWGTPYQMGFAQGQLFQKEVPAFVNSVWAYFESQIEKVLDTLPLWLSELIAELGSIKKKTKFQLFSFFSSM